MTPEQLLKPRWKCIARYPDSPVGINQTLQGDTFNVPGGTKFHFSDYPAIFKPLQWWEERKAEDMPEYIRLNKIEVVKVTKHFGYFGYGRLSCEAENGQAYPYEICKPATKQEYDSQRKEA